MAELIPLTQIIPNPYQPRQGEDPEHIKKIALSIADRGLMQTPVGRRVNGHVQLAFGHSRLAAFRWLVDVQPTSDIEGDYSAMPVEIRELSDLDMFEMAVRENVDRKDLSPVEQARAMLRYRDEFKKTSEEIGRLFGLSGPAVRNKMRLVELPEEVQEQLGAGKLTEGQARELLTVARVAAPERVTEVATAIAADPGHAARTMETALDGQKGVVKMWEAWRSKEKHLAGEDLWPLSEWTWEGYQYADWKTFQRFWRGPEYPDLKSQYEHASRYVVYLKHGNGAGVAHMIEREPARREDVQEAVNHLFRPPLCTACPYYARNNGNHYCGAKVCHERKTNEWKQLELKRISEETGIKIYNPDYDGQVFEAYGEDWNRTSRFRMWYEQREPFLRLRAHKHQGYGNSPTGSCLIQVISFGEESLAHLKKQQQAKASKEDAERIRQEEAAAADRRRAAANAFLIHIVGPALGKVFRSLKKGVVLDLCRVVAYGGIPDGEDPVNFLARRVIWSSNSLKGGAGPVEIADYVQGVATTWGVDLPGDWLEIAKRYDDGEA